MHRKWPTCSTRGFSIVFPLFSLHIRSMWETICDANHIPVHIPQTVIFCPNFPESPFLELQTRKLHPLPISENFRFEMTKVYSEIPPPPLENFRFEMTKVYSEIPPPHFRKLQIWDDQSLLQNTPPPISENFQFEMTSLLRNTPPPISENFRFEMTKVYSKIPPHFGKLQIWDDQSLLRNTPPPHFGKLQIWDDQSLLRNTPPPISENPGDRMWRLICDPQGYHSFWI